MRVRLWIPVVVLVALIVAAVWWWFPEDDEGEVARSFGYLPRKVHVQDGDARKLPAADVGKGLLLYKACAECDGRLLVENGRQYRLPDSASNAIAEYRLSPDGRWLLADVGRRLKAYDLSTGDTHEYETEFLDWAGAHTFVGRRFADDDYSPASERLVRVDLGTGNSRALTTPVQTDVSTQDDAVALLPDTRGPRMASVLAGEKDGKPAVRFVVADLGDGTSVTTDALGLRADGRWRDFPMGMTAVDSDTVALTLGVFDAEGGGEPRAVPSAVLLVTLDAKAGKAEADYRYRLPTTENYGAPRYVPTAVVTEGRATALVVAHNTATGQGRSYDALETLDITTGKRTRATTFSEGIGEFAVRG